MSESCHECDMGDDVVRLRKCPICHKHFCEEHSHQRSGLWFCSKGCSEYFFFSEPDD